MRELEDLARAALQAEEREAGIELAGKLEAFDERGDAGAVNVLDAGEIDDDARRVLFLHYFDEHGAELRGVVERDVTVDVHDRCVAGLSSGKIHEARSIVSRCSRWRNGGKGRRR